MHTSDIDSSLDCQQAFLGTLVKIPLPQLQITLLASPRRSDTPAEPSAPRLPFFPYMIVGFPERKRDMGPFWGSPDQSAFWETAEGHWMKLRYRAVYA